MIIKNNKELKQKAFKNEKELQSFFESNLKQILNYTFVETEFAVDNFRIDTLAFDDEAKAFKIIEYKNVRNRSLVDQGYTYLKLLLERKADFVLCYNEKMGKNLKLKEIDWSQSRVVFVSPTYTTYQLHATDFKNIPIDLVRVTKYEGDIINIELIQKESNAKIDDVSAIEGTKNVAKNGKKDVTKEIKVYEEEDHLKSVLKHTKQTYAALKERILELGDVDVDVKKRYIAFKGNHNIVDIQFTKTKIWAYINMKKGTLRDPMKIASDCSDVGHWGNGDYRVAVSNEDDIDNLIPLIKQSLAINGK